MAVQPLVSQQHDLDRSHHPNAALPLRLTASKAISDYELAAMSRTVQACQKREMVAGWALTGSNLADVG